MRRTLTALVAVFAMLGASSATADTNGFLPESVLAPIATGVTCEAPAGQLSNEAAASWNSMALGAGKHLTDNGCDSAYRPFGRQLYFRDYWCGRGVCGNAAFPGTSNHGLGNAIDVPTWVQGYLRLHGKRYGWVKNEAFSEPWHWTHLVGSYGRPNPGTSLHSPRLVIHSGGPGQNVFVRKAQKLLRGHGLKTVDVDGAFGHSTLIAVRHFQKAERIPVTGVISPRVWKRLRRPVAKPVPTTPKHVPHSHKPPPPPKHHPHKKPKGKAWGIDTSSNNGTVDYAGAKRAGASFAIVKATESTNYVNPYFTRETMRSIGAAGLVPGAYDFLDPSAGHSGKSEAAFFTVAVGHAGFGKGWLPPAADIEQTSLSPAGTCHYLGEWVHLVKRNLGVKPMVYASPGFVSSYLSGCSWLARYHLWVANYGVSHPDIPAPWKGYALWQYTPSASLGGTAGGPFDVSKVFRGRAALVKLRVRQLPKRATARPRAKVTLPLMAESLPTLRAAAPEPEVVKGISEVPVPEGELEAVAAAPDGEAIAHAPPSLEQALAELIHALAVVIGGQG